MSSQRVDPNVVGPKMIALLVAVTAAALFLPATPAHADERDAARQAFRRGSQHYKLGEYRDALSDFKEAYRKVEDPSFIYNIAQCERQLDLREDAVREYRMYLAESPDAPNREEVRVIIAALANEIAAERARRDALAADSAHRFTDLPIAALPAPPRNGADLTVAAAPRRATPAYKKWWVWTLVGVVAGGAAAGLAVGLTRNGAAPTSATTLGTAHPFN